MIKVDNRYEIIKDLGSGLSGEVLLVKDETGLKALKFLKIVQMNVSRDEALSNFKNEFSILSELNHPGIARILDFGFDAKLNKYYFTSELIEGKNFFDATDDTEPELIEQLAVQVFRALGYLHTRGIYHLDIKPQNILVQQRNNQWEAKIIDFGLSGLNPSGKLAGTPAYMSPEIILRERPDGRSDLYSFGALLYKAFTRTNPFADRDIHTVLDRQQNFIPEPPSHIQEKIPKYWDRILERLLKKNPSERYAQASFAIRDINFLASKNYEIETADTRLSYLLDKGSVVGRQKEMAVFQNLFSILFSEPNRTTPHLIIVEGKEGTGKTRLLSEFKYDSQLHNIPVFSWKEFNELKPNPPALVLIDEKPGPTPDKINLLIQQATGQKMMVIWATSIAPTGWSHCEKLTLENFTDTEITEYLMMVTGLMDPPQNLVREILSRTSGNPLFVTELLKSLLTNNLILDSSGRWAHGTFEDIQIDFNKIKIPDTLSDLLKQKYLKLNNDEKKVLEIMAVGNRPLSLDSLRSLTDLDKPQGVLLALIREDVVERVASQQTYFFKNILLRNAILETLASETQREIHDRMATSLGTPSVDSVDDEQSLYHIGHGTSNKKAVEALLTLMEKWRESDRMGPAIEVAEEAWKRASQMDLHLQIDCEIHLAECLILGRDYKKAISHYQHIKEVFEAHPDFLHSSEQWIEIYEKMGDLYTKLDAFDEALVLFRQALAWIDRKDEKDKSSSDPVHRMVIENYSANVLRLQGNIDEAEKMFLTNDEAWEQLPPQQKKKVFNNRLAEIFAVKKEYDLALRQTEKDLVFFEEIGNNYLVARSSYLRGDVFLQKMVNTNGAERSENQTQALKNFERSLAVAKKMDAYDMLLRTYNGIGSVYYEEKDYDSATDYYQRALAISRKLEDLQTATVIALNLGNIYKIQKNFADAYSHLIYAINTLEGMENKTSYNWLHLWNCYVELAEIHRETGEFTKAEDALNQAGAMIRMRQHLAPYEFWISLEKAKVFCRKQEWDLCEEYMRKAKALAHDGREIEDLKKFEEELMNNRNYQQQHQQLKSAPATSMPMPDISKFADIPVTSSDTFSELETILQINKFINSEHDPKNLLQMVLHYALTLTKADAGLVLLKNEDNKLEIKAHLNASLTDEELTKISSAIAQKVLLSGEAVMVDDALSDGRFGESESVVINELKSILCLPIRSKNKIIGVFYLDNHSKISAFKSINLKVLGAYCDQVAMALANAQLIANTMALKKQLEEKLAQTSDELAEVKDQLKAETSAYLTKYSYSQIISRSKKMSEMFRLLDKVTDTTLAVSLFGASGTGKELIARALHYNNAQRSTKRFVAINCGAIPANLIESELFGYKAGSFTGATKDKKGLIEEAHGGTLLLDEIGDLDLNLQVKLLRVFQEGEVHRVGDTKPIKVDVRVLCASHKPLEEMVKEGKFREDLYFRLCQLKINLPTLSERIDDIPLLVEHFIKKYKEENKINDPITAEGSFLKALLQYNWPGNIRELENLIAVACALRNGKTLTLASLPANYRFLLQDGNVGGNLTSISGGQETADSKDNKKVILDNKNNFDAQKTWAQYEGVIIAKCLQMNGFKKLPTADMLGISHSTLYKKIHELDLENQANPIYQDRFVYQSGSTLKDYIPKIFKAALEHAEHHPYGAIRQLDISQGYFYKVMKQEKSAVA